MERGKTYEKLGEHSERSSVLVRAAGTTWRWSERLSGTLLEKNQELKK